MSEHFHMIDYIHEAPDALQRTLDNNEEAVQSIPSRILQSAIRRVVVAGMGSSYTAAVMAAPMLRYHSVLPTHVLPASELVHYAPRLIDKHTLVVAVSRSGERGQVVNALTDSIERGAVGVAITGVADSLLAQTAQLALITGEGPEITFPKTKSVITTAGLLMRLALVLSVQGDGEAAGRLGVLRAAPGAIRRTLEAVESRLQALMPAIQTHDKVIVAGSGSNYGTAMEAAMKIQEAAYVETHYEDTGNLMHSPLGVLNCKWLSIMFITEQDAETSFQALELTGKFGAHRLSVVGPGLDMADRSEYVLSLPDRHD